MKLLPMVLVLVLLLPDSAAAVTRLNDDSDHVAALLQRCAEYCERLKGAVFHFYCLEEVTETIQKKLNYPENRRGLKDFLERNRSRSQSEYQYDAHRYQDMRRVKDSYKALKGGVKTLFTFDYQIIQMGREIREQRRLLKVERDKKVYKKSNYTPILYSYKNAMVPIYFFSANNQAQYRYMRAGKDRVLGRKSHTLLVFKKGAERNAQPLAKVWIDTGDFSIIKFTVFPGAIEGYRQLMRLAGRKLSNVKIQDVHEFGLLKNGLRYPTRTSIILSYTSELKNVMKNRNAGVGVKVGAEVQTRIQTLVKYKGYNFFNVNVARPVFKQLQ
jgi:hypothetical protein